MNLKLRLLVVAAVAGVIASLTTPVLWKIMQRAEITDLPETTEIPAGDYRFRQPGIYRVGTRTVDAPLSHGTAATTITIMKYQVGQSAYSACVQDGACMLSNVRLGENMPQVMVSYFDAVDYAKWFSAKTKRQWRLPSASEWRRAAGDKYEDSSFGELDDARDPAQRWLLEYARQTELRSGENLVISPRGENGANNLGLYDISGNVWEWTSTCFQHVQLDKDGKTILKSFQNCAVRAAEGKHTAYINGFVRDANAGGCAAGIPPGYLGFRLVLDS